MQRYFVEDIYWDDHTLKIVTDDFHHLTRVMRMKPGDQVICNDQHGKQATCEIMAIETEVAHLKVVEWLTEETELPVQVTIVQGLPKGDKLDLIVQKATELGVNKVIPFDASRSIVKWDQKKAHKKIERLNKIAKEASEQSHRRIMSQVESLHSLKEIVKYSQDFDYCFVAYEETTREVKTDKLANYFSQITPGDKIMVLIGPEGGLTNTEIDSLYQAQFKPVRFGPRILRTETAPLYLLAALSFYFEEME